MSTMYGSSTPNAMEALNALRSLVNTKNVTILCHCIDEKQCHRTIIKQMTEERQASADNIARDRILK